MKYAESICKIWQFQLVKCYSPVYYLRKVSINRARRRVSQFERFWFSIVDCSRIPYIRSSPQKIKVLNKLKEQMNRWHSTITFNVGWAYNNPFGQSASQYKTEEYTFKLNRFRGRNLTHCWENDPYWRTRFIQVSPAIIKSKFFDGLYHIKDGFFQSFNLFYIGLVFCDVLDFEGEIFKHSYSLLQSHKIFPGY